MEVCFLLSPYQDKCCSDIKIFSLLPKTSTYRRVEHCIERSNCDTMVKKVVVTIVGAMDKRLSPIEGQ